MCPKEFFRGLQGRQTLSILPLPLLAPLAAFMQSAQPAESAKNNIESSVLNGSSSVLNSEEAAEMANDEVGVCDACALAQKLGLPTTLQEELQFYRGKQRHTRWETDAIVLKLCKGRWLTPPQLSILMDRTPKVLRRDCIAALVRHGQLTHKEEKLTHQNQAYRTVE